MEGTQLIINDKRQEFPVDTVPAQQTSLDIVAMAMQKGYSPELISQMMDLAERNEKNAARKAYFEAMAAFKATPLKIVKDQYNKRYDSWYSSLGSLLDTVNPGLGANGLSLSFPTPTQTDKTMTIECRISHKLGHTESFAMIFPIDAGAISKDSGKPSRTPIQDIKSTFTYGRSATCEGALGIAGSEASVGDDDGNGSQEPEYITSDQVIEINDLIKETSTDLTKFLEVATAERVEEILAVNYAVLVKNLKKKREAKK